LSIKEATETKLKPYKMN